MTTPRFPPPFTAAMIPSEERHLIRDDLRRHLATFDRLTSEGAPLDQVENVLREIEETARDTRIRWLRWLNGDTKTGVIEDPQRQGESAP
jgi:hypothetical protein